MKAFTMTQIFRFALIAILITTACSTTDSGMEEMDHGFGTVAKMHDALDAIVPTNYKIEKLAGEMIFTEGPVWIEEGGPHLLFSDIPANAILRWAPGDTSASVYHSDIYTGELREGFLGSNGLTLDRQGRLLAAEHGNRRISRQEGETWVTVIDSYMGKKLNSPNDLVWHPNGWLYFTDPPYGLTQQDEDPMKELDFNGIFRLNYETQELELLSKDQTRPNGIGFSPDGMTAYVANSDSANKVWMAYDVNDMGMFENGRVFFEVTTVEADGSPDGLKLDNEGNIYATGPGGVWIFAPDGTHLGTIQPVEIPANVGWGDDGSSLYMTARTGLYRIKLMSKGSMPVEMVENE